MIMTTDSALEPTTRVQRAPNIIFEAFDSEYLAIDGESGYCYSLNETAGRVWDLIETPAALGDICEQVCRQYAVEAAVCHADVTTLVARLHDYGLVQLVPGLG
jgi:hypothetical protein